MMTLDSFTIDSVKLWKGSLLSDTKTLNPPHQTLVVFREKILEKLCNATKVTQSSRVNTCAVNISLIKWCGRLKDDLSTGNSGVLHAPNPRQFWKWFEKGRVLCCWKEYFSTLVTPKLQTQVPLSIAVLSHPVVATNCELLNCSISLEEVNHAVMSLNNSKSPGVD